MTPYIKSMLRKKNKLIRKNRIDEASSLALKIQGAISRVCDRELRNIDKKRGTSALWKAVNNLTKGPRQPVNGSKIMVEEFNNHYARRVSTDPLYVPPALRSTAYNNREDLAEA